MRRRPQLSSGLLTTTSARTIKWDTSTNHTRPNSYAHLMNESIADCIAILRVREEADDSYDTVIDGLVDAMTRVGFPGEHG